MKSVACAKEKFGWDDNLKHARDYDWLCEAVTMVTHTKLNHMFHKVFLQGFSDCLEVLVQQCGICVNAQSIERAQT